MLKKSLSVDWVYFDAPARHQQPEQASCGAPMAMRGEVAAKVAEWAHQAKGKKACEPPQT